MISIFLLFFLIILVILSGFLSGSETAITATSKARILYKKKFVSKSEAMSYEYKLKHDKILRKKIITKYD